MAEKNQIIINVVESNNSVRLGVSTDVNLSSYGRCAVISSLLKSLDLDVDWSNPVDTAEFCFYMYQHLCKGGTTKVEVDGKVIDMLKGGAAE